MNKEELIQEINSQLEGLATAAKIADDTGGLTLKQIISLYDLQFRLKCKLYELTSEV